MASHIFITGASSGIGAALARYYAAAGCRLSLLARNAERLTLVAEECRALGASVETYLGDVTDASGLRQCLLSRNAEAPIDVVYANAGIGGADALARAAGEDPASAVRILTTNMIGVVNTVAPLLPEFVRDRRGHIVLIGSLAGEIGLPHTPAYCASKAAIRTYGDSLRRLLARSGVRVTVVSAGFVATPMADSLGKRTFLVWSAERAARHIAMRVARGYTTIRFPWPLAAAIGLGNILPTFAVDYLMQYNHEPEPDR